MAGAGTYRERLRIQQPQSAENRFGVSAPTWTDVGTIYAQTIDAQGSEPYSTAHDPASTRRRFLIRARNGLNTAQRLILNDSLWYDIESVVPVGSRNREMILEAVFRGVVAYFDGRAQLVAIASIQATGTQEFRGLAAVEETAAISGAGSTRFDSHASASYTTAVAGVASQVFSGPGAVTAKASISGIGSINLLPASFAYWAESQIPTTTYPVHLDERTGGHDMRLGSTGGAYLSKGGFLRFGAALTGDLVEVLHTAAHNIVGDFDFRAVVAASDWTPAALQTLVTQAASGTGIRLQLNADGTIGLLNSNVLANSTVATGATDGTILGVRCAGHPLASNGTYTFYTKVTTPATAYADCISDSGWTQLGAVVLANRSALTSTAPLHFGMRDAVTGTERFIGKFYAACVKDGINGTAVCAPDFTDQTTIAADRASLTEKSANAATVTITVGSTAADSADPACVRYLGHTSLYFPGVAGNRADSTIGATFNSMAAGTLSLRCRFYSETWRTTAGLMGSNNSRLSLTLLSSGVLRALAQKSGATNVTADSTVAVPNATAELWVRWDYDWATQLVTFYTAPSVADHTLAVWTQLGATVAMAVDSITSNTIVPLFLGAQSSGGTSPATGQLSNGVWLKNGVEVLNIDATILANYSTDRTTLTAVVGGTITLVRSSGRKLYVSDRNLCVYGTDDYAEMYDVPTGLAYPFTLVWIGRIDGTPTGAMIALSNSGTASQHCRIRFNAGVPELIATNSTDTETIVSSGGAVSVGATHKVVGVFRSSTDRQLYVDDISVGTGSVSVPMPTIDSVTVSAMHNGAAATNFLDAAVIATAFVQQAIGDVPLFDAQLNAA